MKYRGFSCIRYLPVDHLCAVSEERPECQRGPGRHVTAGLANYVDWTLTRYALVEK